MKDNKDNQNEMIKQIAETVYANGFGNGFYTGCGLGIKIGEIIEADRTIDEIGPEAGVLLNVVKKKHNRIKNNIKDLDDNGLDGDAIYKYFCPKEDESDEEND